MRRTLLGCFMVVLLMSGCGTIKETAKLEQTINRQLIAGVGDTVLKIDKQKNLPNLFGKADIYGRKTSAGYATLQYIGVENNHAKFIRKSMTVDTGATTMNSTPFLLQNNTTNTHSGFINGRSYMGTSTTNSPPTLVKLDKPDTQILDKGAMQISVRLGTNEQQVIMEGYILDIIEATPNKITYSVSEL